MLNVCHNCGSYRPDKTIDPSGPFAICPDCGYAHPFIFSPLFVISGASGTGKSTVVNLLARPGAGFVVLDGDILWRPQFNDPANDYRDFMETWLRLCKNIAQSGQPVLLFGAGFGVPANLAGCVERRYFPHVHTLALVCSEDALTRRLLARPSWRASGGAEFLRSQLDFNRWFIEAAARPELDITNLDTSHDSAADTARQVVEWARARLPDPKENTYSAPAAAK
jgi:hypothetical protein